MTDPDAPREGRLASLVGRGGASRGRGVGRPSAPSPAPSNASGTSSTAGPKLKFTPKFVARRQKEGTSSLSESSLRTDGESSRGGFGFGSRGRGRGRGRFEAPLVASGPLAQGPAAMAARARSTQQFANLGSEFSGFTPSQPKFRERRKRKDEDSDGEEYSSGDDDGEGGGEGGKVEMKYVGRMADGTLDDLAPVTSDRIRRKEKKAVLDKDLGVKVEKAHTHAKSSSNANSNPKGKGRGRTIKIEDDEDQDDAMPDTNPNPLFKPEPPSSSPPPHDHAITRKTSLSPTSVRKQLKRDPHFPPGASTEEREEATRIVDDFRALALDFGGGEEGGIGGGIGGGAAGAEDKLFLFQFPSVLPRFERPAPTEVKPEPTPAPAGEAAVPALEGEGSGDVKPTDTKASPKPTPTPAKPTPTPAKPAPDQKSRPRRPATSAFPPPPGLAGQLRIHRSGRTTLSWGGIAFDVTVGSDVGFLQDVVAMDVSGERKCWSLGGIGRKVVVVPDVGGLVEGLGKE
ncbi:hypothetical protein YB2330_000574 [Saitoella coloradoensis]